MEIKKGDEEGGNDPNEWDDKDDNPNRHYSDKGGHEKRGDGQDKSGKGGK